MPARPLTLTAIVQMLDEGEVELGQVLFFPEVRAAAGSRGKLMSLLRDAARHFSEADGARNAHRRTLAGAPVLGQISVTLEAPRKSAAWREPVALELDVVHWPHGADGFVAFVPQVGIEVIAPSEVELRKRLPEEVRHALQRSKDAASLYRLALQQRVGGTELEPFEIVADVKSPRERVEAALAEAQASARKAKPIIEQVGTKLSEVAELPAAYEADAVIAQMVDVLSGRKPRSVLLVGPSGVGKTAAVMEMVRRRGRLGALRETPFWATSGSRLVAGMSGFGMWQERCTTLCREAARAGAIVHLGNLVELMEVGRGEWVGQGIAGFLRPYLGRGDVLAIAECTAEQLPVIERQDPHLLEVFVQIKVEEPTGQRGREILRRAGEQEISNLKFEISDLKGGLREWESALSTLDRLHRRYAGYSAYPGRPLRFLKNLIHDRFHGRETARTPITAADVTTAFSRETGLPALLLDDAVPLDLASSRAWFAARVIGQGEAVDLIADLLATVKAALNRPRRPIASVLFIGPTGVGKTEMAKALAEFFFADRGRMSRFDMSEYASSAAVTRLLGGAFGGGEGMLTAKVREQPFSLVLLDEFEKAHPSFFDLLLQVLGDGRLTDAAGRVADFSNAIVVMTSNLGAETFGQVGFGLARGGDRRADARRHFTEAVREFLRPEMFNRIDRIVPFLPLDRQAVLQIVRRELALLERRDGFRQRGLAMRYTGEVAPQLAQRGYDPQYGARPLKRRIERELLAPLSEGVNQYSEKMRLVADVEVGPNGALKVNVRARAEGSRAAQPIGGGTWGELALRCATARREMQALERAPALLAVRNEIFSLQRRRDRRDRPSRTRKVRVTFDPEVDRRLERLSGIDGAIRAAAAALIGLEDRALTALYDDAAEDLTAVAAALATHDFDGLLLALYGLRYPTPNEVTIGIIGPVFGDVARLATAYISVATRLGGSAAQLWWFSQTGRAFVQHRTTEKPEAFLARPDPKAVAIGMRLHAPGALARFLLETGVHEFIVSDKTTRCVVDTAEAADYAPSPIQPPHAEPPQLPPVRRTYRMDAQIAEERSPRREFRWTGRKMDEALAEAVEEKLHETLREMLRT
jgi:ATP-dependent Clp protease ATP-binding subunit ClpA